MMNKWMQVVEEKVELIKEESPWKEEIEQLSNKKVNFDKSSQNESILKSWVKKKSNLNNWATKKIK